MIAVIADDFSGAAEIAGWAVAAGFTAELRRDFAVQARDGLNHDTAKTSHESRFAAQFGGQPLPDVVVFDTDSRSAPIDLAIDRSLAVAAWLRTQGIRQVFKKIDSVLRGHVAAESNALRHGLDRHRSLVVPANPRRQRVVRDGRYRIAGQPLHETLFARDPDFPAWTDQVVELLECRNCPPRTEDQHDSPRAVSAIAACAANCSEWPAAELIVGDASSLAELDAWTARVDEDTLPVGAAEFFASWLGTRFGSAKPASPAASSTQQVARTLLVCGSPAAWFQERGADARARELAVLRWGSAATNEDSADDSLLRAARETLASRGRLLVTCHEEDRGTVDAASPDELLRALGGFAQRILAPLLAATHPRDGGPLVERLLVEGGATTAALVQQFGWQRFEALAPVADGITPLVPLSGIAIGCGTAIPRFTLFSKPGSYAWPADLW